MPVQEDPLETTRVSQQVDCADAVPQALATQSTSMMRRAGYTGGMCKVSRWQCASCTRRCILAMALCGQMRRPGWRSGSPQSTLAGPRPHLGNLSEESSLEFLVGRRNAQRIYVSMDLK